MKTFIVIGLLYSIGSHARPLNLNEKYFDSSYHQNGMNHLGVGGVRSLAMPKVPSLSPLPSPPQLPTKDDLPSNKTARTISSTSTPPRNKTEYNGTFSLEGITQPGVNATSNPSSHFSHVPSDIPSFVPSQSSSDELSKVPSDLPSLTPSDAPSLTTQVYSGNDNVSRPPSFSPTSQSFNEFEVSAAPVSVPVPTLIPSAIPTKTNSESSSSVPTQVKNNIPTAKGSATPSEEYSGTWSSVPSSVRSNTPSTIGSVTATPSEVTAENRTSRPSQSVASNPSRSPIEKSSTDAPSVFTQADIPNQDEVIHSTVQLLELTTSVDNELSEDDANIFQAICKSKFLATFLPKTHEAKYNKIGCVILNQSIDKQSEWQDERGPGEFLLSILLQVRSEVNLPDNVAFSNIVSLTFQNFSEELQILLGSMANFAYVHASDKGPIVTEIQSGTNRPSRKGGITTMLVGALLGGAVLALFVSGLIIHRSRQSWGTGAENTRAGEDAQQNRFTSASVRSVPRVIGFTIDRTAFEKGRALSPKSVASENSCNSEDIEKNLNVECHSRTNSAERTEGSASLDSSLHGLDLLQSSVSSGESKLPEGKKMARMKIGRRRKSDDNSHKPKETQMLNSLGSDDASTDLECGMDMTSKTHTQNRVEDCLKVVPSEDYVQCNEAPKDESIVQMHLDDLAHTGEVLNDLGQFEEQWHDRLTRVRVSASAETPRQANTQYRRPPRSRSMIISSMSNDVLSEFTDAESL